MQAAMAAGTSRRSTTIPDLHDRPSGPVLG
jgi:hypothetical protein